MGRAKGTPNDGLGNLDRRGASGYAGERETGRVLPEVQGEREASTGEAGPPAFPALDDLKAVNRAIHDDAGQPERYALDQPSPLEGSIERARQAYEPSPEGVIHAAALLAHGIAQAQSFRDGNRRTAYIVTKAFLDENGLGFLGPTGRPDHMLVRYLNQVVDNVHRGRPVPGPDAFEKLFLRRLRSRRRRTKP